MTSGDLRTGQPVMWKRPGKRAFRCVVIALDSNTDTARLWEVATGKTRLAPLNQLKPERPFASRSRNARTPKKGSQVFNSCRDDDVASRGREASFANLAPDAHLEEDYELRVSGWEE
ncbi:MAG: hypothetical protein FJ009_12745 [Chloroflexi bacterium]|nr:hypothetical protein [Chloroflexota bacterium]